jgi:hypothetical protein
VAASGEKGRNKKWGSSLTDRSFAKNNFPGANVCFTNLTMPVEKKHNRQTIYLYPGKEGKNNKEKLTFLFLWRRPAGYISYCTRLIIMQMYIANEPGPLFAVASLGGCRCFCHSY